MKIFDGILEKIDKAGYYSIECWGGATFDSCLRYLNEDPWERLRKIRSKVKNTKLQMLLRGQNLLGYRHYPDDVVRMFVRKSIENGMDIVRIFDALNALRNIEVAVDETIKAGSHTQGGVVFGKIMYKLSGGKINPLIGSAGVSAVPMAARVSQVVGQKENPSNFLLMHAMGPNVAGVIGSAVAAGVLLTLFK